MKGWLVWSISLYVVSRCDSIDYSCDGTPFVTSPPQNSPHFALKISNNPSKYSPKTKYQVSIQQTRQGRNQKMTGFSLIVEPSRAGVTSSADVGSFYLIDEALTAFSNTCPNMVTQASNRLIPEMSVHWISPSVGTGCVTFRATVIEPGEHWTRDDKLLSWELCEDSSESADDIVLETSNCCACDEAKYEVTFEGLWSRHTHPKDFPPNGWLTRFSDVIGASHTGKYKFWEYGKLASAGLKEVGERGWTRMLESELKAQSDKIRTIIKARGISYPNVTGKTFAVFRVDRHHHLMSLVSMIVPSPDWIVGVSGLELCLGNCSWIASKVINLNPWDIGTDSGVTYTSPDSPTIPQEPITQITSSYPDDKDSPFYDPSGEKMKPLARLIISRQRLYEKSCSDVSVGGDDEETSGDCAVTEWVPQQCSVTCGRGTRHFQRKYLYQDKVMLAKCSAELTKRESCQAPVWCTGEPQLSGDSHRPMANDRRCGVTDWTEWSGCSATCGHAVRMRSREYRQRGGRKLCTDTHELEQTSPCLDLPDCPGEDVETCDPQWADWTPCSVSCGVGLKTRITVGHSYSSDKTKCAGVPRTEQVECVGRYPTCDLAAYNTTDTCQTELARGDTGCRMNLERWYFDKDSVACREFIYTGCKGNENNFVSKQDCLDACSIFIDGVTAIKELGAMGVIAEAFKDKNETLIASTEYSNAIDEDPLQQEGGTSDSNGGENGFRGIPPLSMHNSSYYNYSVDEGHESGPVNCKTSSWGKWQPCSVTCGRGVKRRYRYVKVHPRGGGKPCPPLVVERKCKARNCGSEASDSAESLPTWGEAEPGRHREEGGCVMGPWSPWTSCSATCGLDAVQVRTRIVQHYPPTATGCPHETFQSRSCDLVPCM